MFTILTIINIIINIKIFFLSLCQQCHRHITTIYYSIYNQITEKFIVPRMSSTVSGARIEFKRKERLF